MKGFPNIDEMEPEAEAPPEGEAPPPAEDQAPEDAAADDDPPEEEGNVSPEEQEAYSHFVASLIKTLYSESTFPRVMESIRGGGDPVQGLASTVVNAIVRVQDAAAKAGDRIAPEIIFQGGREILEDLAETASMAGIHTFSDDEIEAAGLRAIDLWRDQAGRRGELDEGVAKQDFNRLREANAQGRLGDVVPGIDQRPGAGRAPPQEEDAAMYENGGDGDAPLAQNEAHENRPRNSDDENSFVASDDPPAEDPEAEAATVENERRRRRRSRRRRQGAREK